MSRTILVGKRYKGLLSDSLAKEKIDVIWLPDNTDVDPRLAGHADLSVLVLPGKKIILCSSLSKSEAYPSLVNYLTNDGYELYISEYPQRKNYPMDINLCAAVLGNKVIHYSKYSDPIIKRICSDKIINVRQGYTKCSACVLNEHAIITADKTIAASANSCEIDVLLIEEGHFYLAGYNYGFIGGSSFVIENTIYCTGHIYNHPSSSLIMKFAEKHGFSVRFLTNLSAFDFGGAIIL